MSRLCDCSQTPGWATVCVHVRARLAELAEGDDYEIEAPLPVWWFLDCGPGRSPGTRSLEPLVRSRGEYHPCDENGAAP